MTIIVLFTPSKYGESYQRFEAHFYQPVEYKYCLYLPSCPHQSEELGMPRRIQREEYEEVKFCTFFLKKILFNTKQLELPDLSIFTKTQEILVKFLN